MGASDEMLNRAGRNRAISAVTGRQISFGAPNKVIDGPINVPTGDALRPCSAGSMRRLACLAAPILEEAANRVGL